MDISKFIDNIIEQIKEAQLKLGYAGEVIRLYFPVESLCGLLQVENQSGERLLGELEREEAFGNTVLGRITFSLCKGERVEVCISPEGAAYVNEHVPNPPFLVSIIELFRRKHDLTIEEVCACFARFNRNYICEKMEPGTDFDYVLYFPDQKPDAWYYCIHMEMGHTIYHRFTEKDYHVLIA